MFYIPRTSLGCLCQIQSEPPMHDTDRNPTVSTDPCICPTLQHCHHQYGSMYLSHTVTLSSSVWTHVSVPHCDIAIVSKDPCICATLQHCYHQFGPMYMCHESTLPLSVLTHVSVPQCDPAAVSTDPCICPTMRPCRSQY